MNEIHAGELKTILHSKRANLYYLEHCRVLVNGGRVEYVTDAGKQSLYWNIPIANTSTILLGTGTSITQAAMRELAKAGVMVGFCGGGGTPLIAGTEAESARGRRQSRRQASTPCASSCAGRQGATLQSPATGFAAMTTASCSGSSATRASSITTARCRPTPPRVTCCAAKAKTTGIPPRQSGCWPSSLPCSTISARRASPSRCASRASSPGATSTVMNGCRCASSAGSSETTLYAQDKIAAVRCRAGSSENTIPATASARSVRCRAGSPGSRDAEPALQLDVRTPRGRSQDSWRKKPRRSGAFRSARLARARLTRPAALPPPGNPWVPARSRN